MDITYIAENISIARAGVATVVRDLFNVFSTDKEVNVEILTTVNDGKILPLYSNNIRCFPASGSWRYSKELRTYLENKAYKPGVLWHIHGVWLYPMHAASKIAVKKKVPYIMTIHSMLFPWHLRRKWWKLIPYFKLIEKKHLKNASCIHAITKQERDHLKALVPALKNIEVIPNSIDPDYFFEKPDTDGLIGMFPQLKDRPVVLFVGRLHPQKSVQELIEAWLTVVKKDKDHILFMVGPDQIGLKQVMEQRIAEENASDRVIFAGHLSGGLKAAAYKQAKIFVSPAKFEVIGLTNLEAMCMKIPLLTTRETGLEDIERYGSGRFTTSNPDEIAASLLSMISMTDNELNEMGEKGRKMVEDIYSIEKTSAQMKDLYKSLI